MHLDAQVVLKTGLAASEYRSHDVVSEPYVYSDCHAFCTLIVYFVYICSSGPSLAYNSFCLTRLYLASEIICQQPFYEAHDLHIPPVRLFSGRGSWNAG